MDFKNETEDLVSKLQELSVKDMDLLAKSFDSETGEFDVDILPIGLQLLVRGYIEYAREVIINRALPTIDGFKPVHKRILYIMKLKKIVSNWKCQRISSEVLSIHPHGDAPVYQALAKMTDENGTWAVPLIEGMGNFGAVHNGAKPAKPRYTEARMHEKNMKYLFTQQEGVKMLPSFDASTVEPELISQSIPLILINHTQGIAVGFSCNIPSYNFIDIISLTAYYVEHREFDDRLLYPDFSMGGFCVRNDKEARKIMETGSGRLRLRARMLQDGKELWVTELPHNVTTKSLVKQIDSQDIQGVKTAKQYDDYDHQYHLVIECNSKARVSEATMNLYRLTSLQTEFNANITIIKDGEPTKMGVYDIIKYWCEVTADQIVKEFTKKLANETKNAEIYLAFNKVLQEPEKKDKLADIVLHESNQKGVQYILDNFEGISRQSAEWIVKRRMHEMRDGGKYAKAYDNAIKTIKECEEYIENPYKLILKRLKTILAEEKNNYPRRTEITDVNYTFDNSDIVELDNSECTFIIKDGFIRKLDYYIEDEKDKGAIIIEGNASDTLIGIDSEGRVIRIYCADIPYVSNTGIGIYIPKYLGLDDITEYRIMWLDKLDGRNKLIVYKDGTVGFLNTGEWYGNKRQQKVIKDGVHAKASLIGYVDNVPDFLFVADEEGKFSYTDVQSINKKSRTARTRVFNCSKNVPIEYVAYLSALQSVRVMNNMGNYYAPKMSRIENKEDFIADETWFKEVYNR